MQRKIEVELLNGLYAELKIDLSIPKDQKLAAQIAGVGEVEQQNLIGQRFQEILALLGCEDGP